MMLWPSLKSIALSVQNGEKTALELTKLSLSQANKFQNYNSILRINPKAIAQAKKVDMRRQQGKKLGRLAGVPFLAKDNFLTEGLETTAGSKILSGYVPPYTATAIKKLLAEDAILIGKTNLDAFAHGSSTENSDFGPTKNPVDTSRVAGGSSGGAASAVALGIVPLALGSDTGGSIRQPASFCGVVGLKPTYGLISRYGVVAMASSTDVVGPITNSVEDSALALDIMAGSDWQDSTIINREDNYTGLSNDLKGVRVGVVKEFFEQGVTQEVNDKNIELISKIKKAGAEVVEVSIKTLPLALPVYYVVVSAEVSSNLSRYDGMRYGPRSDSKDLTDSYLETRSSGFNPENRRRIMIGTYVLSSGYYDAYYSKAQKVRTLIIEDFSKAFSRVDILIGPTAPTTAFKLGEKSHDPVAMYMSDVLTVGPSLAGLPAISIPIGTDKNKLPVGMQLIAKQSNDKQLLGVAQALEVLC